MRFLCALLAFSIQADPPTPPASYSDGFADRYSVVVEEPLVFEPETPLEDEIVVHSPTGEGTARLTRTDGVKVPYEENVAHVVIEHRFGDTVYLRSTGFRTINVTWIGERYVFINKGIGHVAAIEEIFDLVERKWLVQHSVAYRWP